MRRLTLGRSIRIADLEVVPVELTCVDGSQIGRTITAFASKEAVAIVIRSPLGVWALDAQGAGVALDTLINEVEDLRNWIS